MTRAVVYRMLDAPGLRWLLSVLGSCYVTARRRTRCAVTRGSDAYLHHFPGRTVVRPFIGGSSPAEIDATVADGFFWAYTPREGDVVVDIGAGTGEDAVTFQHYVGRTGRVVSIEAHPDAYRCLRRTVELNDCTAVTPLHLAVGERAGIVNISNDDGYSIGSSVITKSNSSIPVPMLPFDDVARSLNLTRIDLLKINIEGAEIAALKGMTATLALVRHAVVACHDFLADAQGNPGVQTMEPVRRTLEAAGFSIATRADLRPWVSHTIYATRVAHGESAAQ
jgi:FkbM family methyltransferase